MFEEEKGHNEEEQINFLISRFDDMVRQNDFFYFDSEDLERILDYFIISGNREKIQKTLDDKKGF